MTIGHLVEGGRERHRDRPERLVDQLLERAMADGADGRGPSTTAALGHGARILGAMELPLDVVPAPDVDGRARTASSSMVEPGRPHPLPRLGRAGRPTRRRGPGVLLIHGLGQTAWIWTPVARRLRARPARRRDGPARPRPLGRPDRGRRLRPRRARRGRDRRRRGLRAASASVDEPFVLAGHGFGAIVAAAAAARDSAPRCAGLVLVDGGWERSRRPPGSTSTSSCAVSTSRPRSCARWTRSSPTARRSTPRRWDADQERAARATVVETHAGRVVPTTRPHVTGGHASGRCSRYDPLAALGAVTAPVVAIAAADPTTTSPASATRALRRGRRRPSRRRAARRSASCRSATTGTT